MRDKNSASREEPGRLDSLAELTLNELSSFYFHSNPEKNEDAFTKEFFIPMLGKNSLSGDSCLEIFESINAEDKSANLKYAPMVISCAYCVQAIKELERNQRELAWFYVAEARYWCGVVRASVGIEESRDKTIKATRKNTAQKGGKALAESKYKEIKDEVFKLAREKRPEKNGWRSRLHAAKDIKIDVLKFACEKKLTLSEEQAETTIYGWLKKMPDAASLFPNRNQGVIKSTT